ncbi:MAG: hypothetical protein ACR2FU_05945 [Streptosporangiaceae bacterium]
MSFSQHLVLWLHVAFVIFTIGPATIAIMSTPRYIRQRDVRVLRYLSRMTTVFAIGTLAVLIAGMALASMLSEAGKPWIIVSATLFLVSVVLLVLVGRDQRHAIKTLEAATATAATATGVTEAEVTAALERSGGASSLAGPADPGAAGPGAAETGAFGAGAADAGAAGAQAAGTATGPQATGPQAPVSQPGSNPATAIPAHLASVERGRIAMLGGVVSLIWLVILVLMVWNS